MGTAILARFRPHRIAAWAGLVLLAAGCGDAGLVTATERPDRLLRSGVYEYNAWSTAGGFDWWGTLDLEVSRDGRISGYYRLPRQCTDRYGYAVDCTGYVGGRVYQNGELRFGLDEGWLRHFGEVRSRYRAAGDWDSRILGFSDFGRWEIVEY